MDMLLTLPLQYGLMLAPKGFSLSASRRMSHNPHTLESSEDSIPFREAQNRENERRNREDLPCDSILQSDHHSNGSLQLYLCTFWTKPQ
jgi:hypothetical protein